MEARKIELPQEGLALPAAVQEAVTEEKEAALYAKQMPKPAGYKILVATLEVNKKTDGGIIRLDEEVRREEIASPVGFVIELGPDCYKDPKRFPNGPYCKVGDFVLYRAYSGTRVKVYGKEFRLINDDTVEAVVEDPRGITRA